MGSYWINLINPDTQRASSISDPHAILWHTIIYTATWILCNFKKKIIEFCANIGISATKWIPHRILWHTTIIYTANWILCNFRSDFSLSFVQRLVQLKGPHTLKRYHIDSNLDVVQVSDISLYFWFYLAV